MNKIITIRIVILLFISVVVIGSVGVFAFDTFKKYNEVNKKRKEITTKLSLINSKISLVPKLQEEKTTMTKLLESSKNLQQRKLALVSDNIAEIAKKNDVSVLEIVPKIKYLNGQKEMQGAYTKTKFNIKAQGGYINLVNFLSELTDDPVFLKIEDIQMSRDFKENKIEKEIVMSLEGQTYCKIGDI